MQQRTRTNADEIERFSTEAEVRKLPLAEKGERYDVQHATLRGFMVRIGSDSKSWAVKRDYRLPNGKVRTFKKVIGRTDLIPLKKAHEEAQRFILDVRAGKVADVVPEDHPTRWSVGQMLDNYLARSDMAPRTREDIAKLRRRFLADLEGLPLAKFDAWAVTRLLDGIESDSTANQLRAYLNAAYRMAETVADLPANPVRAKKRAMAVCEDHIEPDELPGWWEKVRAIPNPTRRCCVSLTLLSGLRPGLARALRKEWLAEDRILIPREQMKARKVRRPPHIVPLSQPMREIIAEALQHSPEASPYLFPGPGKGGHISQKAEPTIPTKQQGHALRRTYATVSKLAGIDSETRKMLLDHRLDETDEAYLKRISTFPSLLKAQETITAALLGSTLASGQ